MAQFFCSKCGSPCNEGALFCNKCGNQLSNPETNSIPQMNTPSHEAINQTSQNNTFTAKVKTPGRGLGISSLVLGIIGVVFSIMALDYEIDYLYYSMFDGDIIFVTIPILSAIFGKLSRKIGYRHGMSLSGLVLGIIGISFFALTFLIDIFN